MAVDFVAIDFETSNFKRASACSVGAVKVKNGKIVDTYYSLINPEDHFDSYNIFIHGITPEMVKDAPTYPEVIKKISDFKEDLPLVAHYAPFDMGVIKDSNKKYSISNFDTTYFDSYYLSKQYLTCLNYKLDSLAKMINFKFEHHNALEDSKACVALINYLCQDNSFSSIEELINNARYYRFGEVHGIEGIGFNRKSTKSSSHTYSYDIGEMVSSVDRTSLDENHPFFEKFACFTGKLESMPRKNAMELFAKCGGFPEKGVNKKTNFLIVGDQDLKKVGEGGKSSKIIKAEKLLVEGQDIQLLGEEEFIQMIM